MSETCNCPTLATRSTHCPHRPRCSIQHLGGLVCGGELGTASVMYRPIADVGQARGLTRFLTVARATAAASVHA